MDPIVTSLVKTAEASLADAAKENSRSFLKAVLHEPAQELGSLLGDKIRERRHANLIKITSRAHERLKEAGLTAKEVLLAIIHPALEAASVEEDMNLQEVWANLLASAAGSEDEGNIYPSFPIILRELTAQDVKFLDALFTEATEHTRRGNIRRVEEVLVPPNRVQKIFMYVCLGKDLSGLHGAEALEMINKAARAEGISINTFERNNIVMRKYDIVRAGLDNQAEMGTAYSFTSLGACFVRACRGPHGAR